MMRAAGTPVDTTAAAVRISVFCLPLTRLLLRLLCTAAD